jgi:peptidoglycan/xylan/chitin deacetylase (PgdA/CDA1 family)
VAAPLPPRITRRREERRRQVRRRRAVALSVLAVLAAAGVYVVGSSGGDSSGGSAPVKGAGGGPSNGGGSGSKLVRNATPQPDWTPHRGPVPILMYHVLGQPISGAPYPDLFVPRAEFRKQMDWLDRRGYQGVTLDEVERAWYGNGTLPRRPIVISFDDGYRPQYTFAFPQLRRHGWPGMLDLKAKGSDLYTHEVKQMIAAGWELASHTINHLDLTTLDPASLRHELQGSRAILRREYGVPVDNFCYPSGRYDDAAIAAVKAAGYRAATTTDPGLASREEPYTLKRVRVNGGDGVPGLATSLAAAGA